MKDEKNILDETRKAQQAVDQAEETIKAAAQELSDNDLDEVAGGLNNPFAGAARVTLHQYTNDIRSKI